MINVMGFESFLGGLGGLLSASRPSSGQRFVFYGFSVAAGLAATVLGAAPAAAATESPSPSPASTPIVGVDGNDALVFVGLVATGVALLWFLLLLFDVWSTHKWRQRNQTQMLELMIEGAKGRGGITAEELRQLASALDEPPRGTPGLTRSLIALTIVTLIGVAMVATLVSTAGDSEDLRKTIITSLLSTLAAIAGFYYGARTAQVSSEQAAKPPPVSPKAAPDKPKDSDDSSAEVPVAVPDPDAAVTGPDTETEPTEPELLDNPEGDDGEQIQDDDSDVLPTPTEEDDHR